VNFLMKTGKILKKRISKICSNTGNYTQQFLTELYLEIFKNKNTQYDMLAVPILLCGTEIWTVRQKYKNMIHISGCAIFRNNWTMRTF